MTGFKDGASSDPYGDEEDADTESDEAARTATADLEDSSSTSSTPDPHTSSSETSTLPWIYRRSSITDGRTTVQLHLQDTTERRETEFQSKVESELDESVKKADVREAAYLVGMTHLDEVANQLREWGYDFD